MLHKMTVFPLGNADCIRLDLANDRTILFDYAHVRNRDDEEDKSIDLPTELRKALDAAGRKDYDVVAVTHLHRDHVCGADEFFWFEHAKKYQGADRIKIGELWVPAAVITEEAPDFESARVVQAEAQHRLKQGGGIRVFSRPARLKGWLEKEGLSLEDRRHLITDAGKLIPGFDREEDGLEFFVHSPFAVRQNETEVEDRNLDALVVQATFVVDGAKTKAILGADADHTVLTDIIRVTRRKKNEARLEWDIFKLPHHCSYTALSDEKGKDETEPVENVAWLFETQGGADGIIVSTSKPIPTDDADDWPPHRQAAAYYRRVARNKNGEFKVTMEHPKVAKPEPLVIKIESGGAAVEKKIAGGATYITSSTAPRAG